MSQYRRVVPPELQELFDTHRQIAVADLYTITLSGGLELKWTGHDMPVTVGADTWTLGPGLERKLLEYRMGVSTQSLEFTVVDGGGFEVNGESILPFILRGGFDDARVVLWRAYAADPGGPWVGKLEQFTGSVAETDTPARLKVSLTVLSVQEIFTRKLPPDVYDPQCRNDLYDPICGIDRESRTVAIAATGPSTGGRLRFPHALGAFDEGYFDLGSIKGTSGGNLGVQRTVRMHTSGEIVVMQPWPAPVAAGDAFLIYPGCDLTEMTCINKFNNRGRFRGHPDIPPPETIL